MQMIEPQAFAAGPVPPTHTEFVLASRGARLAAALVDDFLAVGAMLPGWVWAMASQDPGLVMVIAWMSLPVLALMAYQWWLIATTGQSLGKRWSGLRIVKLDGSPVSFVSGVLLRQWAFFPLVLLPWVGEWVPLVDVLFIFRKDHRCLHDHLAGTKVIKVR